MDDSDLDQSKEAREKLRKELREYTRKKRNLTYIVVGSMVTFLFIVPPLIASVYIFKADDLSELWLSIRLIWYCTTHQCTESLEGLPG